LNFSIAVIQLQKSCSLPAQSYSLKAQTRSWHAIHWASVGSIYM